MLSASVFVLLLAVAASAEQCEWKIDGEFLTDHFAEMTCGKTYVVSMPDHRMECFRVFTNHGYPAAVSVRFAEETDMEILYYLNQNIPEIGMAIYCSDLDDRFAFQADCTLDPKIKWEDVRIELGFEDKTKADKIRRVKCQVKARPK